MHGKESSKAVYNEWKKIMKGEPYNLTKEALEEKDGCASITCIVCLARIQSPWYDKRNYIVHVYNNNNISIFRKEYTEWRTDHSVALQCHCCYAMFTVKHVGKANLFADTNAKNKSTA
jgi:hypothetical protein